MSDARPEAAPESFKDRVHGLLRASVLDAAWARACATEWSQVRIADIAADVGVSRQTIYNEFGTKDQLADALFEREMRRFLQGMEEILEPEEHLSDAIRRTVLWMLEEAGQHRMLTRLVEDSRAGSGETLLPLLTVRADLILMPVRSRLVELVAEKWPKVDPDAALVAVDVMIRLTLSQILLPTDLDPKDMVEGLVAMATHLEGRPLP